MQTRSPVLERLFAVQSVREIIEGTVPLPAGLSLPDALALTAHLKGLQSRMDVLRLGIVHTFTSDLLNPWLALYATLHGFELDSYHAPYGLSPFEAERGSGLAKHEPDLTLFLLRREDLHPSLCQPVVGFEPECRKSLSAEVPSAVVDIMGRFRAVVGGRLVLTILPTLSSPGLGLYDTQATQSEGAWWASLKQEIARRLREELTGCFFLDLDDMLAELGRAHFFDPRLWYSARYPFSTEAAREIARRIATIAVVDKQPRLKVIVLDADNTLWGGIIGEDGINEIALGPEYPGNTYLDFQRRLLDFQQRGFLLALCSKNNSADVDDVLDHHPHQLLRQRHFAARRVNWRPKTENLVALADELGLGLDSFVFVDDSDHECAMVRRELPAVTVVKTPAKPILVPGCLDQLSRLEVLSLTQEDLRKTGMYAEQRQREQLRETVVAGGGDPMQYLASLEMRMRVALDDRSQLTRLAQLTQKTNQFNLTTRRYSEDQLGAFLSSSEWVVASFALADVFGDSGIVGLALIRKLNGDAAQIDTFLMSCRVIGRMAETAFLETVLDRLRRQGIETVVGEYLPTAKNRLVEHFLADHGFVPEADGRFVRHLREHPPMSANDLVITVTVNDDEQ